MVDLAHVSRFDNIIILIQHTQIIPYQIQINITCFSHCALAQVHHGGRAQGDHCPSHLLSLWGSWGERPCQERAWWYSSQGPHLILLDLFIWVDRIPGERERRGGDGELLLLLRHQRLWQEERYHHGCGTTINTVSQSLCTKDNQMWQSLSLGAPYRAHKISSRSGAHWYWRRL